jgi:hypothetical protein
MDRHTVRSAETPGNPPATNLPGDPTKPRIRRRRRRSPLRVGGLADMSALQQCTHGLPIY